MKAVGGFYLACPNYCCHYSWASGPSVCKTRLTWMQSHQCLDPPPDSRGGYQEITVRIPRRRDEAGSCDSSPHYSEKQNTWNSHLCMKLPIQTTADSLEVLCKKVPAPTPRLSLTWWFWLTASPESKEAANLSHAVASAKKSQFSLSILTVFRTENEIKITKEKGREVAPRPCCLSGSFL